MKISIDAVTAYLSLLLGWTASLMMPVAPFIGLMGFLVFVDMFSGVKAARKRGEKIRSRGFQRTVEKILLYFFTILSVYGTQVIFKIDFIPLVYVAALAICLTELKSILENVKSVTGVNIFDKIKELWNDNKTPTDPPAPTGKAE